MGHEDISTTMQYADVGEADKRDAVAAVFGQPLAKTVAANGSERRT